jgi:hypothetical protein
MDVTDSVDAGSRRSGRGLRQGQFRHFL